MSTLPNLEEIEFRKLFSLEKLMKAEQKARKGKGYRKDISNFQNNFIYNLNSIQNQIINDTYNFGSYKEFTLYDSKKRLIITARMMTELYIGFYMIICMRFMKKHS